MRAQHAHILMINPTSQGRQHEIQPSIIIQHSKYSLCTSLTAEVMGLPLNRRFLRSSRRTWQKGSCCCSCLRESAGRGWEKSSRDLYWRDVVSGISAVHGFVYLQWEAYELDV